MSTHRIDSWQKTDAQKVNSKIVERFMAMLKTNTTLVVVAFALCIASVGANVVLAEQYREPGKYYYDKLSLDSDGNPEYQYSTSDGDMLYFNRKLTISELEGLPDKMPIGYIRGLPVVAEDDQPKKKLDDVAMEPGYSKAQGIGIQPEVAGRTIVTRVWRYRKR